MELSPELLVLRNFFVALLIGALVGVEREKRKAARREIAFGGLRTFILFAQAGAVSAWLSIELAMPWLFVLTVAVVSVVVVVGYFLESRVQPDSLGVTTEMASITVCLLGGAVMYGYAEIALVLGIVTASVLTFKQPLHGAVAWLGMDDIQAALKLLIATFIVLPLVPRQAVDPWGAINPHELWLLVIVVSALSLVGYVAQRWLGRTRGALMTGLAGGLASSTAVSVAFARESCVEDDEASGYAQAAGILLAWSVMFVRIVAAVAIVHAGLVASVAGPCGAMAAVSAAGALFFARGASTRGGEAAGAVEVPLANPFSLWEAIKFCALFAVVLLVVKIVYLRFAAEGLYVVAALAGLSDVDAITLTLARQALDGADAGITVGAILVAALANTVSKYSLVAVLGSRRLRLRLLPVAAAVLATGLLALALA